MKIKKQRKLDHDGDGLFPRIIIRMSFTKRPYSEPKKLGIFDTITQVKGKQYSWFRPRGHWFKIISQTMRPRNPRRINGGLIPGIAPWLRAYRAKAARTRPKRPAPEAPSWRLAAAPVDWAAPEAVLVAEPLVLLAALLAIAGWLLVKGSRSVYIGMKADTHSQSRTSQSQWPSYQ